MPEVLNVRAVSDAMRKLAGKYKNCSVIVGYTAVYALWVHENIEMKWRGQPRKAPHKGHYWDPQGQGQAKFLEQPARTEARKMAAIIKKALESGKQFDDAVISAAQWLQRCSMLLCPVDIGNLKDSAFTRLEN